MGNRLSVTIISSLAADEELAATQATPHVETTSAVAPAPAPAPAFMPEPEPEPELVQDAVESPFVETPALESNPEPEVEAELEEEELEEEPLEKQSLAADLIPFEQPVAETPPPPPPVVVPLDPTPQVARPDPQPRLIVPKKKPVVATESKAEKIQAKQEVMQFEPVSRGRFEKSEPTIVEGQDLDVPTFLRKNIRVK
jgi:cell division protein FtsZ